MGQPLVLRFSTDMAGAKRDLAGLATSAATNLAIVGGAAITAGARLSALSGVAATGLRVYSAYKLLLGGVALGMAAWGLAAEKAAEQVAKLQELGAGAKEAGVSASLFQAWREQAARLGMEVKDLDGALKHLKEAGRPGVDEAGARTPSSVEKLMQGQLDYKGVGGQNLVRFQEGDAGEKVRAVVDQIKALHAEAMRLGDPQLWAWAQELAKTSFGAKGEEIANAIASGKIQMEELTRRAQEASGVFTNGLVAEAQQLEARVAAANERMEQGMKPIMDDLARLGLALRDGWVSIREMIASAAETLGGFYSLLKSSVAMLPALEQSGARLDLSRAPSEGEQWAQAGRWLKSKFTGEGEAPFLAPMKADPTGGATLDMAREGAMWDAAKKRRDQDQFYRSVGAAKLTFDKDALDMPKGGNGGDGSETDEVETYLKQVQRAVDVLKAEAGALGLSNTEKMKAISLAKAEAAARERGTALTEEERQKVAALATSQAALTKRISDYKQAVEDAKHTAHFFGEQVYSAIEKGLQPGAKMRDVILSIAQALQQAALKALILGEGPLAALFGMKGQDGQMGGLFGSLFGGLFRVGAAGGAPVDYTGLAPFAEGGRVPGALGSPVPILAHAGEIVLNRAQQAAVAGGMGGDGGGGVVIHNHAGAQVSARQGRDANGQRQFVVMVTEAVMADIHSGGPISRASRAFGRGA